MKPTVYILAAAALLVWFAYLGVIFLGAVHLIAKIPPMPNLELILGFTFGWAWLRWRHVQLMKRH
jgi:hypothetical protein